jgi:ABC-type Zn uptake system ZnuABC Zn-binding protein ZnuA
MSNILRSSLLALLGTAAASAQEAPATEPLRLCATTTDLAAIAREIGGDAVTIATFGKGTEDAHFIEPRPSFVTDLHGADLLLHMGLSLEVGWLPALVRKARNPDLLPGARADFNASIGLRVLGQPSGLIDRSLGDVHPDGNPHYLLDPLNGLAVAARLRDRLSELRPASTGAFAKRYDDFRQRLGKLLVGDELFATYDFEKLARLGEQGRLEAFLTEQGDAGKLGGWLGQLRPAAGLRYVAEHDIFLYFAHRFLLESTGFLEPKPGVPPTTRHLGDLIGIMKARQVPWIFTVAYYDPRHAEFVASKTGARIVRLAHQVGAAPQASSYLETIDWNVRQVAAALPAAQR